MTKMEINISGTHNRYLIKKTDKQTEECILKKNNICIDSELFCVESQIDLLNNIDPIIQKQLHDIIKIKLSSYQQQDKLKNRFNKELFVTLSEVLEYIRNLDGKCSYCGDAILIMYKNKRDKKHWTLDRIDNSIGHNTNNLVISCLECNIQKRDRNHEQFLFSKNMKIDKLS
jgi:hypothetical protein